MSIEHSSTEAKIFAITDTGLFERLATSVLRISNSIYSGIIHTGVNVSGQPISDPLDGISICTDVSGKKYAVAVEHTITARKDLADKWLNELQGDMPKALKNLQPYMQAGDDYTPRIVLTCKVTPGSDLVKSVEQFAASNSVEVDIWSNDKLANKLDIDPDGQAIRHKYFGITQTRLSRSLAREISKRQVSRNAPPVPASQLVKRNRLVALPGVSGLDSQTVFLSGESGSGKSALCYQIALDVLESGGLAYVLTHENIETSDSMEQALRKCLIDEFPSLIVDRPIREITQLSDGGAVILWIEDVNASMSPADLISKIYRSTAELSFSESSEQHPIFEVFCPVWPDNLRSLPRQLLRSVQNQTTEIQRYSQQEAREVVRRRETDNKTSVSDIEADQICARLAHDPLLIGLWVGQSGDTEDEIISEYVSGCLNRCSQSSGRSLTTLRKTTVEIANWLLQNRSQKPSMDELYENFKDTDVYSNLEVLCSESDLFREVFLGSLSVLDYRHDRVRDYLLINALAQDISQSRYSMDYVTDPFYSEQVAKAALNANASNGFWDDIQKTMPLIVFCALKQSWKDSHHEVPNLLRRCCAMIETEAMRELSESLRRAIEWQIAGLEGNRFLPLIAWTRSDSQAGREARILNGDVRAAAMLCYIHEPSLNSPYRDSMVAHAREKNGERWISELKFLIKQEHKSEKERESVLYLAGECADNELSGALHECWKAMRKAEVALSPGMLYAVVACVAGANEILLEDVFEVWKNLPDKDPENEDKAWINPKYDVANDCLSGGLRRIKCARTLNPLLRLAADSDEMRHAIYGCLEQIDHPMAATYTAAYISEIDERIDGKENHFNYLANSRLAQLGSEHDRNVRYNKSTMDALKMVWSDVNQSLFMRKRHFHLWCGSLSGDQLREIARDPPNKLEDDALITRCRRGDKSAIPDLREKILDESEEDHWFFYILEFDSRHFEDLIISELQSRSAAFLSGEQPNKRWDWVIPAVLAERRDDFAEKLILDHWHHLKECRSYPHLLLYLSTHKTLKLYESYYDTVDNKAVHFRFLGRSYGIKESGRSGLVEIKQLVALEPYIDDFDNHLIDTLWDECTEKGFTSWRMENLDPRVSNQSRIYSELNELAAFSEIDKAITSGRSLELEAYNWVASRERRSMSTQNILDLACRYVDSRGTAKASDFLSKVISIKGARTDLDVLKKYKSKGLLASSQIEDVTFSVRYRTLN